MYSTSGIGFILNPTALDENGVYCSCKNDCGSMTIQEEHGCAERDYDGWAMVPYSRHDLDLMLRQSEAMQPNEWCDGGDGASLEDRSRCRYNEVLLSADAWRERLPLTIEAVFFPKNGIVDKVEGSEAEARQLHRNFLRAFNKYVLSTPLLAFDVPVARAGGRPFEVVY